MDPKKILNDLNKLPVIGDLIIAFAITVILTSFSSAGGYFGFEGEKKELLINIFVIIGVIYFIGAILFRAYRFIKK